MQQVGPERKAYKEQVGCCMVCRMQLPPESLDCHELAAGYAREKCLTEWLLIMVVCRTCHDRIQGTKPKYQMRLLLLWIADEMARKYCELKGYATTHLTGAEVLVEIDGWEGVK